MKYQGKEDDFQITCMDFLRKYYPALLVIHVPNEGIRSKGNNAIAYGVKMKRKGVKKGVSDILIFDSAIIHSYDCFATIEIKGLAIELKTETGKVSPDQEIFMKKLTDRCWACEVCWSVDEFIKIIEKYYVKN